MKVETMRVDDLVPYEKNPRDNDKAVDAVVNSIKEFGFLVPVLIDNDNIILAGHTRIKAAKKLGMKEVPIIRLQGLTEEGKKKYRLIDNKTSELSSWDYELLKEEIDGIDEINLDAFQFGFDIDEDPQPERDQKIDGGGELSLDDFEDDRFENECPYCGFRWNE